MLLYCCYCVVGDVDVVVGDVDDCVVVRDVAVVASAAEIMKLLKTYIRSISS